MAFSLYTLVGAFVAVAFVLSKIVNYIRVAQFKKQHGCQPENKLPQWERIVGWNLYKAQLNASKEKRLTTVSRQRFLDYGYTWSASMMGQVSLIIPWLESQ